MIAPKWNGGFRIILGERTIAFETPDIRRARPLAVCRSGAHLN